jgi:hypothetical protein
VLLHSGPVENISRDEKEQMAASEIDGEDCFSSSTTDSKDSDEDSIHVQPATLYVLS